MKVKTKNRIVLALACIFLLFVVCAIALVSEDEQQAREELVPESGPEPFDHRAQFSEAFVCGCECIREQLLAPSTADFPWYDPAFVTYQGDSLYMILTYVDAENSLGAKIRSNFLVMIRYAGHRQPWKCEAVQLLE